MFAFWNNGKEWIRSNRKNIFLLVGILLVGSLAFESGFLRGKLAQSEPLIISIPAVAESSNNEKTETAEKDQSINTDSKNCAFVGSRNSNKYHLVTCAVVKRIKPENIVCFTSKEDAEKRGYVPSCVK